MKKKYTLIPIAFLLLLLCACQQADVPVSTAAPPTIPPTAETATHPTEPTYMDYSLDTTGEYRNQTLPSVSMRYFPFIYSEESLFTWYIENIIGPNACEPGELYIKDRTSGTISLVHRTPDENPVGFPDGIYFTVDHSQIIRAYYTSPHILETVCTASIGSIGNLWYDQESSKLFFTKGSNIVEFDAASQVETDLGYFEGITDFFTLGPNTIVWKDESSTFIRDLSPGYGDPVDKLYTGRIEELVREPVG